MQKGRFPGTAFTPERHAYSHVNTLASAAKAYEVTGDEKYFKAIENAWAFLTTTQMYASGGWGADERFVLSGHGKLAASLEMRPVSQFVTFYAVQAADRVIAAAKGDKGD